MLLLRLSFIIYFLIIGFDLFGRVPEKFNNTKEHASPYTVEKTPWADSVFNSLTLDEKIAQLFMVAAYSNKDRRHEQEIADLVSQYNIGGLIFFQGTPVKQAQLTNYFQAKAKIPLVIGMDAEWGLGMRLDSTIDFPRQMMLGALQDPDLIYEMGQEIARQMKRLGVHINFAPVVDVNNNPENPVISNRSFGEDPQLVSSHSLAYMMGLQNNRILAVAKHFPGHGDTDSDSHFDLPVIKQDYKRLDSVELYPFKHLISANLGGVMIAHLNIPSLDSTSIPSTLSAKVVTSLLRDSLRFDGLVFTDALNMRGVARTYPAGELEIRALEAGNEILVMSNDIPLAISMIKQAIESGRISEQFINESCRKMLILKEWAGLSAKKYVEANNLVKDLNSAQAQLINRRIIENAITVVKNNGDLVPVQNLSLSRIAVVCVGEEKKNKFTETLDLYASCDHFFLPKKSEQTDVDKLLKNLEQYNLVIVAIMNTNYSPNQNYGVSVSSMEFLDKMSKQDKTILNVFAPPYFLRRIKELKSFKSVIISYEDNDLTQEYSAQLIFGGISAKGILPVTASADYPIHYGLATQVPNRFKYTLPEDVKISSDSLMAIDSIVNDAIKKKAMPGCQVLAAKNGIVFYHKAFGYHTYDSTAQKVLLTDVYDIASITKVASTTVAVMKLYEDGSLKLTKPISDYLPELKKTNKQDIPVIDIMTHQARLQAGIPFYLNLLQPVVNSKKNGIKEFTTSLNAQLGYSYLLNSSHNYKPGYFSNAASQTYSNQVADSLFIITSYEDSMFNQIGSSSLLSKKEYKYSDLGFILMYKVVNSLCGMPMQEYVRQNFYTRLGASTLGYQPMLHLEKSRIVPTELDLSFRQQLVRGYVHDQSAALMGGVSGHAGLFSDANDLAKLFQMLLNGGSYGGEKYLDKATIDYFNTPPFVALGNRRGIGFDKPEMNPLKIGPTCFCVSHKSFGHSGFTGTFAWADPETGLLYIFLSNRVYPTSENTKLTELSVRTKILEVLTNNIKVSNEPGVLSQANIL